MDSWIYSILLKCSYDLGLAQLSWILPFSSPWIRPFSWTWRFLRWNFKINSTPTSIPFSQMLGLFHIKKPHIKKVGHWCCIWPLSLCYQALEFLPSLGGSIFTKQRHKNKEKKTVTIYMRIWIKFYQQLESPQHFLCVYIQIIYLQIFLLAPILLGTTGFVPLLAPLFKPVIFCAFLAERSL